MSKFDIMGTIWHIKAWYGMKWDIHTVLIHLEKFLGVLTSVNMSDYNIDLIDR